MKIAKKDAAKIVNNVLGELDGRGGFDHWWDDIDAEIQREIKAALVEVVMQTEITVAS